MNNLYDSLRHILPRLPDWMVDEASVKLLTDIASGLPPVHYAGFEARLGGVNRKLDLQQALNLDAKTLNLLNIIEQKRPSVASEMLRAVFSVWSKSTSLQNSFKQVWLEFDHLQGAYTLPGMFFTVKPEATRECLITALQELRAMLPAIRKSGVGWRELEQLIQQSGSALDTTHIGFMLSRPDSGIRVVRQLTTIEAIPSHVENEDLINSAKRIHQLAREVLPSFSDFHWCQDLGGNNVGTASIECFFPKADQLQPTREILNWLHANDLSTRCERDVMEAWPAILTPETLNQDWPQSLIFESLSRSEDIFSVIECKLGHIKLTAPANKAVTAKVYFGYLNRWLSPDSTERSEAH